MHHYVSAYVDEPSHDQGRYDGPHQRCPILRLGRCGNDGNFAGFRLIAETRGPNLGFLGFVALPAAVIVGRDTVAALVIAAMTLLRAILLTALLVLLRRLVHRIQDAKVMFRMLEIGLGGDPVAATGRVTAQLQILLEQLLGRAANADVRPAAVKDMVAIERDITAGMVPDATTTTGSAASTATLAMSAAAHSFHVHSFAVVLFLLLAGLEDVLGAT